MKGETLMLWGFVLLVCVVNCCAEREALHEDVSDPAVRSAILSKFSKAKAEHEGHHKSLFLDPKAVHSLAQVGGGKKKMTAAERKKMIEKMKKLREQIMGDWSANTKFGRRADCSYP